MEDDQIRVPLIPDLEPLSGDVYRRVWRLGLEELITPPETLTPIAEQISQEIRTIVRENFDYKYPGSNLPVEQDDFVLRFELASPQHLLAVITTGRYSWTDECHLFAPIWLFMRVEQEVGRIKLIEGEPKESHFFWRARRRFFGNKCPI